MLFILLVIGFIVLIHFVIKYIKISKLERVMGELDSIRPSTLDWNLDKYIKKLEGKKIICSKIGRDCSQIDFSSYGFSYHFSYSQIRTIDIKKEYINNYCMSISLIIGYQDFHGYNINESFEFRNNYLENVVEFYRIVINIVAINKKIEESLLNKVFFSVEEINEFNKSLDSIKKKHVLIEQITKDYEKEVFNLIMSFDMNFHFYYFKLLDQDKVLEGCLAKDGFYGCSKPNNNEEENFRLFSIGLKKRIKSKWKETETLSTVVYLILRNSIVSYYNKYYELNYNGVKLEEYCEFLTEVKEKELSFYKIIFTCHYIFTNDIYLSIWNVYSRFFREIDDIIVKVASEQKEQTLFSEGMERISDNKIKDSNVVEKVVVSPIERIDAMTGEEFEIFIADYFKKLGYKVTITPLSGDYGVDVIIESELIKIGIQAKRYEDRVTNSAIQEVVAGIKHYNLDKGMVITNNYFTRAAKELAKDNNITLWDRKVLTEKIKEMNI